MKADTKYTIILKLLTAIAHLPLSALYHLSNFAYFVIYRLVRYRRDTVRSNLERVFGKDDEDRILQLEKGFYRHFCDCFVETVKLLHISDEEINERVNVTNGEYIDSIIRSGHPVVLFLGHYGNWEWVQAIIRHFSEPLTLAAIAAQAGVTREYFSTLFHTCYGISPWEYLTLRRIECAKERLRTTDDTVLAVALFSGFNNTANFNRLFRNYTGVTPRQYRSF